MQPYIVHIEREDLMDWTIETTPPDSVRTRHARYYNSPSVELDSTIESRHTDRMETWYCTDETSAVHLAEHFSRKYPGRNINIYKLTSVTRSVPSVPTLSKYTEKGLLPA